MNFLEKFRRIAAAGSSPEFLSRSPPGFHGKGGTCTNKKKSVEILPQQASFYVHFFDFTAEKAYIFCTGFSSAFNYFFGPFSKNFSPFLKFF